MIFCIPLSKAEVVDFDRDVRPVLSEYCFHCHGPDSNTREAGLRLDTEEGLFEERNGVIAVVPGKPLESDILIRMLSTDMKDIMPPVKSKHKMSSEDIDKVKKWIESGAEWVEHWGYRPISRKEVKVSDGHPIDYFVVKQLEGKGLTLSEEDSKAALLRRLSLDLTGMPPTPEEVIHFEQNQSEDAYEREVDRLLASPRYGERMAWDWLDAARYADTDGFQGDPTRDMWPWRDWLIKVLNENIPFDQFTKEVLAGDLLSGATKDQVLASAFNRNHSYNNEGGREPEETRVENVMDRLETVGTTWMGLTMNCARCHDHKYDPISHEEYFQLYDFFNQTSESGETGRGRAKPILIYPNEKDQKKVKDLRKKVKAIEAEMKEDHADFLYALPDIQTTMESEASLVHWQQLVPDKLLAQSQVALGVTKDGGFRTKERSLESDVYEITSVTKATSIHSLRLDALPFDDLEPKGKSSVVGGKFVLSDIKVQIRPLGEVYSEFEEVKIVSGESTSNREGYHVNNAFDTFSESGWAVSPKEWDKTHSAIFVLDELYKSNSGFEVKVKLAFQSDKSYHNLSRGRLLVSDKKEKLADVTLPWEVVKGLRKPLEEREGWELKSIRSLENRWYFRERIESLEGLQKQISRVLASSPNVMVMDQLPQEKFRETKVLSSGLYNAPIGEVLSANTPKFLPPMKEGVVKDRLALAEWLVDRDHPLTSRVTVNRYWQLFFGKGLVRSVNDFGSQGDKPTHPELLDWLAGQFMDSGWDVKSMHRLMVTSQTYKQKSNIKPKSSEIDPRNLLLSHAPRYRMPSWMLRDQALSVAGLLNDTMGGKGVYPYQPEGVWLDATLGKQKYKPDEDDRIYRRSIYIFWRRISGPTMLFDVAKRQECEVLPLRTNTPLHSLTTLNEPMFVESARKMAERVLSRPESQRADYAFRLVVSRPPDSDEILTIKDRLESYSEVYRQSSIAVDEILSVGNSSRNEEYDPVEVAAWTAMCSVLLNLDETQNKE